MIDAIALDLIDPPTVIRQNTAQTRLSRKRGRGRGRTSRGRSRSPSTTAYTVGAVLILSNGSRCVVTLDRERQQYICRDERGQLWRLPE